MKSSSKDWIFIGQECGSKWIKLLLKMSHNLQLWTKFPRGQAWKASDLCPPSPRAGTDNARKKNNCQPAGQGAWSRLYMVFSAGLLAIMAPGLEPSRAMTQYVLKCWEWLQPFIFFFNKSTVRGGVCRFGNLDSNLYSPAGQQLLAASFKTDVLYNVRSDC